MKSAFLTPLFVAILAAAVLAPGGLARAQTEWTPSERREEIRNLRLAQADMMTFGAKRSERDFGPVQLELMKVAVFPEGPDAKIKSVLVVSKTPAAQAIVDRVVVGLFASRTAREAFCPYLPSALKATDNLGVSLRAGEQIVAQCIRGGEPAIPDATAQRLATKFSKQIIFIETETPAPVESYTSQKGDIHIFHTGSIGEFELARALVHEYYVAIDSLYVFNSMTAAHALRAYEKPTMTGSPEAIKAYLDFFMQPLLRGSFQLARAFYAENMVFEELTGIKTPNHRTKSCWDLIRSLAIQIEARQDLYVQTHLFFMRPPVRAGYVGTSTVKDTFDKVLALEKAAGVKPSLCEALRLPTPDIYATFFTSGPRPRIGNGTDSKALRIAKREWPLSFPSDDKRLPHTNIDLSTLPKTPIGPPLRDDQLPTKFGLPDLRGED